MKAEPPPLVLHFIHHLVIGGMENGLVNLINTMPASRYRHAIACIEDYSDFRLRIRRQDVEVFALHRSRVGIRKLRQSIYHLCRQLRPVIVHTRNLSGLDALLPARLAGVKRCIHGEHGWDVDDLTGKKWRPVILRRLHSPLISRYITVSRDLENFLVRRVGIARRRITQIYNGVDTDRFFPANVKRSDLLPPAFRGEHVMIVGTVGRAQTIKDQATLLRAFARLVGERPELRASLRVIVIGSGPLLPELRKLAASLQIADLAWLPGAIDNVPDLLRTFDVFVLPSLNEGISNTILEAMASGLPIVASEVGGNPELVVNGQYGYLFPAQNIETLSRLLGEYAVNRDLRQAHSRAARRTAQERFSLNSMVTNYEAVYDSACRSDAATA